jgi:DNA-directed RNA polymerase subunit RPC12/RpoP
MTKEDDFEVGFITAIIILLILIVVIIGAVVIKNHDDKLWNNGHCPVCGSEWEYEQAVGHYYSTDYVYVCNKCGRRIEIGKIR